MTAWEYFAQYSGMALSCLLIAKLLRLKLQPVYRVYGIFLSIDLSGSVLWLVWRFTGTKFITWDYRVLWAVDHLLTCLVLVVTIYLLLYEILKELPGILRFSRMLLNGLFVAAAGVAALTARPEYSASGYSAFTSGMDELLYGELIVDRVVSTVVFLVLVAILGFLLWFPVTTPRNLAVFIIGFTVYTAGNVAVLLVQSLWLHQASRLVSLCVQLLTCACLTFWLLFISNAGESVPTRFRSRLTPEDQSRLLNRLELINESLLPTAPH